jgi:hypothetical protein
VKRGMAFIAGMMVGNASLHDHDKITGIDQFHADFATGFKNVTWWDNHKRVNRHHLQTLSVPEDVNLIDVMEMIVDCVMAGMGRTGNVTPLEIDPEVLMDAFQNTVELMKSQVVVED